MEELARTWWVYLVRGVCAILFGVLALIWPAITVLALVVVFGAYAIVDGVFALFGAGRGAGLGSRGWMIFYGVVSILTGVAVFVWPGITALVLLFFIAAWAVVTGVLEIVAGIRLRGTAANEWMFVISGALSVLFGVLLFIRPAPGALALVWLIGIMAILYGIALVALSFRIKGLASRWRGPSGTPRVV
ncbi:MULTISPECIES: HdeD family acid-resistance protein [Streptosporangium]|uniref:HdeD family acid-resistance protein n=1 Tax=Streptosporangium jomthongense TaxID=1193683 RepID=A0ABV8ET16_9ACTN